ncbi:MAG: murein transglycosylase A [Sphingomonas bacterium]|nr:murein transglycosylase A [Sphingomonas bacterium]
MSACGGRIVPPSAGPAPIKAASNQSNARPATPTRTASSYRDIPSGRIFDGRIVGATPILAAPVTASGDAVTALAAGLVAGPSIASLPITETEAEAARAAFLYSCPSLVRRADASGLTTGTDWQPACDAARSASRGQARQFFADQFETVQVGDGKAFATGYYEPEIRASRNRRSGYDVPIYGRPDDLVDVDLGRFSDDLKGKKIRGHVEGTNFVPYYDRAAITRGAVADKAPVLAWGADDAEVFFLQIQGSGRLRLPDGSFMRVGYATQNGRDYTGIGKLMKDRGLLGPGQTSMQGIVAWLHAHPTEGRAIMDENKSFVFFRELDTPPVGAMGYVVSGGISVAADTKFVPLGAPVFLSMDRRDASGLWVAQDTGGAIKGSNRFDTYWGAGEAAERTAGGMAARGTAFMLLPRGTIARTGNGAPARY